MVTRKKKKSTVTTHTAKKPVEKKKKRAVNPYMEAAKEVGRTKTKLAELHARLDRLSTAVTKTHNAIAAQEKVHAEAVELLTAKTDELKAEVAATEPIPVVEGPATVAKKKKKAKAEPEPEEEEEGDEEEEDEDEEDEDEEEEEEEDDDEDEKA